MTDTDLADEIIARLNKLCENIEILRDLGKLIETRVACSKATADHPTIQVQPEMIGFCECGAFGSDTCELCKPTKFEVGFLGILNGLIGTIPWEGPHKGWGHIAAVFDDDKQLVHFERVV